MAPSDFWKDRSPENRRRLEYLMKGWVDLTVGQVVPTPEGGRNYRYPFTLRDKARQETAHHLDVATLPYMGSRLEEWTEGFADDRLTGDGLEGYPFEDRLDMALPSFVGALTCLALLRHAYTRVHQRLAAEYLVAALRLPLTRAALLRAGRGGRNLSWTVDQALERLIRGQNERAHRLVRALCQERPVSLPHAIALAGKAMTWETAEVVRDEPGVKAVPLPPEIGEMVPLVIEGVSPVEAFWRIACRVAWDFPNEEGRSLLLWLMLGGVSHRENAPDPWKKGPGLVQPALIDALKELWGLNWVERQYRPHVDRLMQDYGAGAVLAELLLSVSPEAAAPQVPLPKGLGWKTFILVGQETAKLVSTGVLVQAGAADAELRALRSPADVRAYLKPRFLAGGPTRQELVTLASALCGRHRTAAEWSAFLCSRDVGPPA